ncbi:MAG: FAD-dependent oxidoreductase [Archangiaceae bacterium]|nr:FAD-dependent oxidoreductase [Archangiaceae bacterium]
MRPTRRDVIASFLSVAAANAACRRAVAPPLPGVLVDQAFQLGHLLRGPSLPVGNGVSRKVDVLVVGAGAAGLSAAWRLASDAHADFLVCELDTEVGGTARSGKNDISAFPWGAHYLPAPLTPKGPVARLLRELGVMGGDGAFAEEALIREPDERLFYRGTWYEGLYLRAGASADDLAQLQRFDALMESLGAARDAKGRRAFAVPIADGSDDAEWTQLDRLSMAQWLDQQGFTSERLKWMVDYACRDDYGASAASTSAWAGVWYFTARLHHAGFLSWPDGNGRLIAELMKSVGAERLQRSTLVHTLERAEEGWRAHALAGPRRTPVSFTARQVVLACPRFVAARLIAEWRVAPPAFVSAFEYSPWVVANLSLKAAPGSRGFPLAWDNVLYGSKSLGYVVATHQRLRASDAGPTVFTWYYPLVGDDLRAERTRLLGTTRDDWEAVVRADLWPAHRDLDQVAERLDVMRWGHAMIRPSPGFVWGRERRAAAEALHGSLHFAHTDLSGLALFEEANHHGVRTAEAALRQLGRSVDSWL